MCIVLQTVLSSGPISFTFYVVLNLPTHAVLSFFKSRAKLELGVGLEGSLEMVQSRMKMSDRGGLNNSKGQGLVPNNSSKVSMNPADETTGMS